MSREDLIAAIVFASGAGLLLIALILRYLREKKVTFGLLLSISGLFCAALTRFPNMQGEAFFWMTIALFAISVVVSLIELALGLRHRQGENPPNDNPPNPQSAPAV